MESWKLTTFIDDISAIKVAAAYYSVALDQRDDLMKLGEISGVDRDVQAVLSRLQAAGMLGHDEPPVILIQIMNAYAVKCLTGGKK